MTSGLRTPARSRRAAKVPSARKACEPSASDAYVASPSAVILATNFTHEGEATAHYVGEMLRAPALKISRIARGIPVGGELEFVDPGTLAQAYYERRPA